MRRVILLLALAGCGKAPPPPAFERPPAPVVVAAAEAADVPLYIDEIGACVARESVTVRPQITGRLSEAHVADGADVKAGAPLFSIDPRPFQAQVAAAEASLAEAKAAAALAATELKRIESLVEKKAAAVQELDAARNAVAVSSARALRNEADLAAARLNLEYAVIKAPFDGRAGRRFVDPGNTVIANETELLILRRLDSLYVDFHVTEAEFASVRSHRSGPALGVEVSVPSDPGAPVRGELSYVDPAVRSETGTVMLRAVVARPDPRLRPGLFVRVRLILDTLRAAVLVPAEATQLSAKGPFVYVVKDGAAELRPVTLGQRHGERVVVRSGLAAGERVVTTGHIAVMPGGKVAVQAPAEASK